MRKKTTALFIFTILMIFFVWVFNDATVKASGNTLYVGGSGPRNYSSIQDAIDDANPEDTVYVYSGVYSKPVNLYKKIKLVGEKDTVLDYNGEDDIISILTDGCTVKGFVIRNCSKSYSGLKIQSDENVIENNFFENNSGWGLYLYYSDGDVIKNNTFVNDGIYIVGDRLDWKSYTIDNNTIDGRPILYYKNKKDIKISHINAGQIILANCSKCRVEANDVYGSDIGIVLGYSCNNSINGNNLTNNIAGIRLQNSMDNKVTGNNIYKNKNGVYVTHSSRNVISRNNISFNMLYGCRLCCNSKHNVIYMNNFTFNNNSAYDILDNQWYKNKVGNFWSDYSGKDANSDGIGDTPYTISGGENQDKYPLMTPYEEGKNYYDSEPKNSVDKDIPGFEIAIFCLAVLLIGVFITRRKR